MPAMAATTAGRPSEEERLRVDKEAAFGRLATIIAGSQPVVERKEARS